MKRSAGHSLLVCFVALAAIGAIAPLNGMFAKTKKFLTPQNIKTLQAALSQGFKVQQLPIQIPPLFSTTQLSPQMPQQDQFLATLAQVNPDIYWAALKNPDFQKTLKEAIAKTGQDEELQLTPEKIEAPERQSLGIQIAEEIPQFKITTITLPTEPTTKPTEPTVVEKIVEVTPTEVKNQLKQNEQTINDLNLRNEKLAKELEQAKTELLESQEIRVKTTEGAVRAKQLAEQVEDLQRQLAKETETAQKAQQDAQEEVNKSQQEALKIQQEAQAAQEELLKAKEESAEQLKKQRAEYELKLSQALETSQEEINSIKQKLDRTKNELREASKKVQTPEETIQFKALERRYSELEAELNNKNLENQRLKNLQEADARRLGMELASKDRDLKETENKLKLAEKDLDALRKLPKTRPEGELTEKELENFQKLLNQKEELIKKLSADLEETNTKLLEASQRAQKDATEVERLKKLAENAENLEAEISRLKSEFDKELIKAKQEAQKNIEQLTTENQDLKAAIAERTSSEETAQKTDEKYRLLMARYNELQESTKKQVQDLTNKLAKTKEESETNKTRADIAQQTIDSLNKRLEELARKESLTLEEIEEFAKLTKEAKGLKQDLAEKQELIKKQQQDIEGLTQGNKDLTTRLEQAGLENVEAGLKQKQIDALQKQLDEKNKQIELLKKQPGERASEDLSKAILAAKGLQAQLDFAKEEIKAEQKKTQEAAEEAQRFQQEAREAREETTRIREAARKADQEAKKKIAEEQEKARKAQEETAEAKRQRAQKAKEGEILIPIVDPRIAFGRKDDEIKTLKEQILKLMAELTALKKKLSKAKTEEEETETEEALTAAKKESADKEKKIAELSKKIEILETEKPIDPLIKAQFARLEDERRLDSEKITDAYKQLRRLEDEKNRLEQENQELKKSSVGLAASPEDLSRKFALQHLQLSRLTRLLPQQESFILPLQAAQLARKEQEKRLALLKKHQEPF